MGTEASRNSRLTFVRNRMMLSGILQLGAMVLIVLVLWRLGALSPVNVYILSYLALILNVELMSYHHDVLEGQRILNSHHRLPVLWQRIISYTLVTGFVIWAYLVVSIVF